MGVYAHVLPYLRHSILNGSSDCSAVHTVAPKDRGSQATVGVQAVSASPGLRQADPNPGMHTPHVPGVYAVRPAGRGQACWPWARPLSPPAPVCAVPSVQRGSSSAEQCSAGGAPGPPWAPRGTWGRRCCSRSPTPWPRAEEEAVPWHWQRAQPPTPPATRLVLNPSLCPFTWSLRPKNAGASLPCSMYWVLAALLPQAGIWHHLGALRPVCLSPQDCASGPGKGQERVVVHVACGG